MPANRDWPTMHTPPLSPLWTRRRMAPRKDRHRRRGVAAILAMMFLIMFGSLSAAMAIASRGNVTTAATNVHVSRAHHAAETGLRVAGSRLGEAANRFLMSNSDISASVGWDLWRGNTGSLGTMTVLPAATGRQDLSAPSGLAAAVAEVHSLDQNVVDEAGIDGVTIGNAMAGMSASDYKTTQWVYTPAVAIEDAQGDTPALCYSVIYAPLANGTDVRAIVTGYDFSFTRNGQPITRTMMQDFHLSKRVNHAIISPSRVMLGKNVDVTGDLGLRYTDVTYDNGDPLVARSDFRGLTAGLDQKLNYLRTAITNYDVDGDNRLRIGHAVEGDGAGAAEALYAQATGDTASNPYTDATGDGFVDEFDVFIKEFDTSGDHRVSRAEFTNNSGQLIDASLFDLIDSSNPDRNRNGLYGFIDSNGNGFYDTGEVFVDVDSSRNPSVNRDQVLGYMDGYLDKRDRYTKVVGKLVYKVDKNTWTSNRGAVITHVEGAIRTTDGASPTTYNASNTVLPSITASSFSSTGNDLQAAANGSSFASQVAALEGVPGAAAPSVSALSADANNDGRPDNYTTAYWEKMPYNSPNFSDYYYRPVYRNIVFRDVQIPMGTNALFVNCWFIGVTWVRTDTANTHSLWTEYGKLKMGNDGYPAPNADRYVYGDNTGENSYPTMLPSSACPPNQMIMMATVPMDKADIPANQVAFVTGYSNLPDPLVISGLRVVDTKPRSNNIRFHDCLFVGSIVSDAPSGYTQARNKVQFTGRTRFVRQNPDYPDTTNMNPEEADLSTIEKSSLMLPGYSVDVGSFNSPNTQNVDLHGAVIAGVLDVRGNAVIDGALLLTYAPAFGQGPLQDALGNPIGNPAAFNTTLGYFGSADGDQESIDPSTLPIVNGVRVVGWDTNGDGLADVAASQAQPNGSTAVPFNGFGRVHLRFNPSIRLPNGIMLPLQFDSMPETYREGRL
ncbi:MAG: hypothetical protein U0637_05080 [Phycisphaerales bacterium]